MTCRLRWSAAMMALAGCSAPAEGRPRHRRRRGQRLKMSSDTLLQVGATPSLRIGQLEFAGKVKRPERPPRQSAPKLRWEDVPEEPQPPAGSMLVDPAGRGVVAQHRGRGRVETQSGQRIALGPNERVAVDPGGRAGEKTRVLPAPLLVSPEDQAVLAYAEPASATTVLAWSPVPRAARYHVVIAEDAWFTAPLRDRADLTGASLELVGLAAAKYYWRVAAVDGANDHGVFSEFSRVSVERAAPGPPLVIESLEVQRNVLRIRGKTEAGATVTVNAQKLEVLPDGSFVEYVTLTGSGTQKVVIRAEASRGRVTTIERFVTTTGS